MIFAGSLGSTQPGEDVWRGAPWFHRKEQGQTNHCTRCRNHHGLGNRTSCDKPHQPLNGKGVIAPRPSMLRLSCTLFRRELSDLPSAEASSRVSMSVREGAGLAAIGSGTQAMLGPTSRRNRHSLTLASFCEFRVGFKEPRNRHIPPLASFCEFRVGVKEPSQSAQLDFGFALRISCRFQGAGTTGTFRLWLRFANFVLVSRSRRNRHSLTLASLCEFRVGFKEPAQPAHSAFGFVLRISCWCQGAGAIGTA